MHYNLDDIKRDRVEKSTAARYQRLIILLVAVCCLSVGVTVGALVRGIAGAKSEDNRLSISQSQPSPDSLSAIFAKVASQVEPSVVHIRVSEGEERSFTAREGTGSGMVVNTSGFIITNQHVVRRASKITVKLADGTEYPAKVIGQDAQTDLAVIKIEPRASLPVARMGDSDRLNVGDWVLAIGSPFGLEQTVTAGIISAKDRVTNSREQSPFQQFLQTDAAINPGNSGGPLVNLAGEVVGINTQIATTSGVFNGIGFALPSAAAVEVYNQLVTNGRVRRGYLGIWPVDLTPPIARVNKIDDNNGVVVNEVLGEGTPAGRAGLQSGDVIRSVNGKKVKNSRELIRLIASLPVGSQATIGYVRNGEQRNASVALEERRDEGEDQTGIRPVPLIPRAPRPSPDSASPRVKPTLGLTVKTLQPELARQRGFDGVRGVYVVSLEPDSAGEDNGIRVDDIITEINYKAVVTLEDFLRLTRDIKSGDDIIIKVMRKDRGPLRRSEIISFTMP